MKCPFCKKDNDRVIDSRASGDGRIVRRRRECLACKRRFTTKEQLEERALYVIKKDGRREPFDREKIRAGLRMACKKRPVPMERIDDIVARIEGDLLGRYDREVRSKSIGDLIMRELKSLDHVAYVRFASVYREFKDVAEFMRELKPMLP
ncbi:MAG TPA: transcriptional regulator NrdR [Planctomycetota bacterium]|jgi:transcriptional repressor NrdR|nr:transcriptional regulator NrdR [Planctomycetota bacterium]